MGAPWLFTSMRTASVPCSCGERRVERCTGVFSGLYLSARTRVGRAAWSSSATFRHILMLQLGRAQEFFLGPAVLGDLLTEAREVKALRVAKAELAAMDAELLRALSGFDSRRLKLSLTLVGEHVYAECEGQSVDGPLTRASL